MKDISGDVSVENYWGILANTLGIFMTLFFLHQQINSAIDQLRLPPRMDFYFLAFFATVAAFAGGFIWSFLLKSLKLGDRLGGTAAEPQYWLAHVWPAVTNSVSILFLVGLNLAYNFMPIDRQLIYYAVFVLGIIVGSGVFYNVRLFGHRGFREYLLSRRIQYRYREFLLAVLWSGSICLGFVFVATFRSLFMQDAALLNIWVTCLEQTGFTVIFTVLMISFIIITFTDSPRYVAARGIVAGIALRIALFFGILFL